MECKIVELLIDNSIEHKLDQNDYATVQEHLNKCDECKKYYSDTIKVHSKLNSLFSTEKLEKDVSIDVMNEIHLSNEKSKTKPVVLTLIASILIFLCIQFNTELYAFAEKLPLVGNLLDYFKSEDGVAYAKENDYETFEHYCEQDGYKLYLNDIFIDESLFSMQFSIEDMKGNTLSNYDWDFTMNAMNRSWYSTESSIKSINPWQNISFHSATSDDIPKNIFIDIRVEELDLEFKNIEINLTELKSYESRVITLNKKMKTEIGTIEFKSLTINPSSMYLEYFINENENYNFNHFSSNSLIDSNGKIYEFANHTAYLEDSISIEYTSSIYFENKLEYIKFATDGLNFTKFDTYGKYTENNIVGLEYIDSSNRNFTIEEYKHESDMIKLKIRSDEVENEYDFPTISLKLVDGSWRRFHYKSERVLHRISTVELEKLFDIDLKTLLADIQSEKYIKAFDILIDYCYEKYGIAIDEKKASFIIYWTNNNGEYLLSDSVKVREMEYELCTIDDNSNRIGKEFELSFSSHETLRFEDTYEFIIDLN